MMIELGKIFIYFVLKGGNFLMFPFLPFLYNPHSCQEELQRMTSSFPVCDYFLSRAASAYFEMSKPGRISSMAAVKGPT